MDLVDRIIAYEEDRQSEADDIRLFSELVKTGKAWVLQGHYGRTATAYIQAGVLDAKGNILVDLVESEEV